MSGPADIAPVADGDRAGPGPGARLKAAREQRGLALGAVAESLHVAPRLVAAMEADDFAAFDAPVYAKGFLRKYAALLGIPPDEVLAAYAALAAGPSQPTLIPAMNVAAPKSALPRLRPVPRAAALVVGALALVAAGFWLWTTRPHGVPAPAPVAADSPAVAEHDAVAATATSPASQPARAEEPAASVAVPPAPEAHAPPGGAASVAPQAAATPGAQRRAAARDEPLVIEGVGDCWTEVYSLSGTRLLYDLVRNGESRSVPGPGPWRVVLGVADGARLSVGERAVVVPPPRHGATTAIFVVARDGAAH